MHKNLNPVVRGILDAFVFNGLIKLCVALKSCTQVVGGSHAHCPVVQAVSVLKILAVNNAADYDISMHLKGHRVVLVHEASNIASVPNTAKMVVVNEDLRLG